jgi:azurin
MNTRLPLALFAALLVAGCGKKDNVPATTAAAASTAPAAAAAATPPTAAATATSAPAPAATASAGAAAAPAAAKSSAARVVEITANDQMKFSVTSFEAKAGEQLKVVLNNIGTLPKEAMGHNWVLLKAGTDPMAFGMASMTAKATDYIAPAMKDSVVAFVPLLGPKQSGETTFTVPAAGEYPFVCSFPGHVALMKGVMIVK